MPEIAVLTDHDTAPLAEGVMSHNDLSLSTVREIPKHIRRARLANSIAFMTFGASFYAWSTGVSALRFHTSLDGNSGDFYFGMIALGMGVGSTVGALLTGRLIDAFGARIVLACALLFYGMSFFPFGASNSYISALLIGIVFGTLRGACDTSLNTHGVQIERFYGRTIMSEFHACFAFGGFLYGLIGSYFAGYFPASPFYDFALMGALCLCAAIGLNKNFLSKNDITEDQNIIIKDANINHKKGYQWVVLGLMVGFGALLLSSVATESAVTDWGQEFMRRHIGTTSSVAGIAISCFTGAEFVGRLFGDSIARRIGRPLTIISSAFLALVGMSCANFIPSHAAAIIGFSLIGIGVSCLTPLIVSCAGSKDPENQGKNIGIVFFVGYCGTLLGPAIFTLIVSMLGIGKLFIFPVFLMIALAVLGPILTRVRI
ncbi:major facilitator superfamily transporter [Neokomagataea thailandica NBRC 106555]|nr:MULTISPECIES: MFS transporter [Neokomagataea]GBR51330.1 major facilitator superfamily transporter [Neokomagataea thailandica NBRC 106555]